MPRRFKEDRLVLATHNAGKLAEIEALLAPLGIDVVSCGKLGLPVPVEDGDSFVANATLKAKAAVEATGLPALADDSGIEAFGIDRRPGVYSADWAGPDGDFRPAMTRVCDELRSRFGSFEEADKRARFVATLCLAWPDGHLEFTEGEVLGHLVDPPRGQGGFGYDPMFVPEGRSETFGEMSREEKQKLSHRARAMDTLLERCFS
jgi:XTP/dITP diphosphohydrolase